MSMDGRYLAKGRMPVAIFIHPTEGNVLDNQETSEGAWCYETFGLVAGRQSEMPSEWNEARRVWSM